MSKISYTFDELIKETGFKKHSIRHYMKELGIVNQGTAGKNASYPKEVRDKLVFYSILRTKAPRMTLQDVRKMFEATSADTIARVADGDEPLEVKFVLSPHEAHEFISGVNGDDEHHDVLTVELGQGITTQRLNRSSNDLEEWKTIRINKDIELRVREKQLGEKNRQLNLLVDLFKSIF